MNEPVQKSQLFQCFAMVIIRQVAFILMGFDFLANGRILLLPKGLPPVLNSVMKMLLTYMTSINGAGTAAGQHKQGQEQQTRYRFHWAKVRARMYDSTRPKSVNPIPLGQEAGNVRFHKSMALGCHGAGSIGI